MATDPSNDSAILHFLNTSWHWILAILTGSAWTGTLQNRVKQLEAGHTDLKNLPIQVAKIEAKIDLLLQNRRQG